mgnify:CR=1 FL=1
MQIKTCHRNSSETTRAISSKLYKNDQYQALFRILAAFSGSMIFGKVMALLTIFKKKVCQRNFSYTTNAIWMKLHMIDR